MREQLPAEVAAKLNTAATPVTKDSTPAQSYVSGASLLGDSSLAMGPSKADSVGLPATNRNKNTNAQIIGRGLSRIIPSVGAGATSALDSTADAASDIAFRYQSALAKQTNSDRDLAAANVARRNYEKANSTHLLGDKVKTWEQTVAEKNAQIVKDNPDSKLAETAYKATQYAQTVGEMLPSVAASALVGGAGIAAMGGKQALALAGTSAAKAAAVSAAGKLGQAVGLGVMAMNVYDKSLDESTALGYDFATSSKKAFGDAALEVGTEMLFGGIAGLGTGVVSQVSKNVVNRSIAKAAASEGAEQLIKMTGVEKAVLSVAKAANRVSSMMESTALTRLASHAFGEAAEEMISEFLGPYIERMTTNPNASNASIDQIIEAGIGGAIVSFAMAPLGKLQTMVGTPDADIVEKARLTYKLQDYDQNVRMMKDLIYDAVAGEDLTAVEKQMGRELTKVSGDNVAKGLTSDYQRQAARILNDLEASGHTAVDVSNAWKSLGELYAQVSQERSDAAAARIHNDVAKNTLIAESASVKKAQAAVDEAKAKFDEAVKAYDIAVNRNDGSIDTEAARKARAETERTFKNAQANLEKEIENARRGAELRLSKEGAAEKYGQEAVDNFLASQRVKDIQRGRFYATDANGNERLYTKDQYAAEKFGGKRFSQLTKAQKAEVDAASKSYQDAVTKELEAFAKRVNDAITQRGLGGKLRVELVKPGEHKFDVGYAHNGVIYFTQERVHTTEAADYFLSHEFLHAIEDKFISQEAAAEFHKTIRSAMDTIGFNYDEWFARLAKRYESSYLPRIKSEAKQKGKKGKELDSYVKQKFVKLVEGEIRARFMQTAFSSQSILQSLAVETPELLERAKQSVNDSSIAELTDTMWDYERLVILDRINKALTAPVSAETNKKKNADAVEQAFKDIDEASGNLYNADKNNVGGNEDARNRRYYVAKHSGRSESSNAPSAGENKGLGGPDVLSSGDYENKRPALLERARGLRTLRNGAEIGEITFGDDSRSPVYQYVKNREDLPGTVKDTLADMDELSRFSVSTGKQELLPYFVLDAVRLNGADGGHEKVGGFYDPTYNIIVVPFKHYEDYVDEYSVPNSFTIPNSFAIRHEQTHAVQYLIPDSCDLFIDELYSSSGFSARELNDLISDCYKYHLRYYGDSLRSAESLYNELFSDIVSGSLGKLPQRYQEQLLDFRKRFAPVLTQFVNERGLNIDFTDWLEPTKTELEMQSLELEKQSLEKEILHEKKLLFRDAIDAWASDNGLNIDDLDFFPNGQFIYVVKKQSSEILDIDTMMSIPESDYVAILDADSDDNGGYLSGGLYEDLYSAETEEYPYFIEEDLYFEDLEDDGIGMTEERLRQYRELQAKYGENEFGVPNKINSNVATSRFASRLAANKANIWSTDADGNTTMTGVNTPEDLAASLRDGFLNGVNTHIVMTDDAAIAEARSRIDRHKEKTYSKDGKVIKETVVKHKTINDAFTYAKGLLTSGKVLNKNDLAFAQQLIVEMTNQYKELNEGSDNVQPIESKNTEELFNQIQELVADTCAAATRAGQNLQAFSLLKKMTPTGRLYYIESQADQLISELVDRRGQSRVSGYFFEKDSKGNVILDKNNKPKRIIISDELRKKMYECTTKEEMNAVEEEIIAEIASKIDPSLMDRVTAWRYLSMLGNPRTHVRNIVSNFTMGTMVKAKNRVGGALEDIFLKDKTQGRTKTLKAIDPELRKSLTDFAENDWAKDGMSDVALSGGKVGFQNRINEARKKMKLDILDKAAKKNGYLLELEDDRAGKRAYKEAFVRYAAANNLTVEYLSAGTVESNVALAQARSYAVNEAAKATYHDASKVASMLNELEHMRGGAGTAAKLLIGGIAPFKKTPINILSRGIEYSPIGLVDGLVKTIKACQSTTEDIFEVDGKKVTRTEYETTYGGKGGKFVKSSDYTGEYSATSSADALDFGKDDSHGKPFERFSADAKRTKAIADALDQMAAGLTGTGLLLIGALLAQLGLMKGSGDDENKDAEYYDQMLGNQEYSITIGNKNYTLDWLTPVSMPLFAGVELHNAKVDGGEMSFEELIDAIGRVADPITNLSFLQGVNDAMSEYDSGLYSFARSAAESFAGQFVPTVFGQVARSIDPTRRTTYAPKDSAAGKKAATFINKMENKIPGLSQKNAAYVDLWGRTETNNGDTFVGRLFMNSVAPTYVRTVNKTEADDYLTQLFAKTGDNSIIPKSPESSYTVSGETFYLTSQEYQQTKELVGQLSHVGVTSLLSVPGFAELSAEDQADLVSDVYSFAKRVAKEDYAYANGIEISVDSTNTKIKNAVLAGMSIGEAVYVYKMANLVEGVKNSKGNTISGSKKANLLSFYRTMGLTNEQINAIKPSNYDFDL